MSSPVAAAPRNVRLLYLHNFLVDFRFQSAFLVIYFTQITGSYAVSMMMLSIEMLSSAVLDIPTGIFSDRVGRRYTIAFGSVCATTAVCIYAFATKASDLAIGAAIFGLSSCLFSGNNSALLIESLKDEQLGEHFHHFQGRAGSMFQLALGLSALCGGVLASHGLKLLFILGIAPQACGIIVSLMLREPKAHVEAQNKDFSHFKSACLNAWSNKRLRLLILGRAISYGAGESAFSFKGAYVAMLWPIWAVGLYRSLNHAVGFISFWFAGKTIERFTAPKTLIIAEIYWFVTESVAVLLTNVWSPLIMMSEAAVFGSYSVACEQLLQNEYTNSERATMGSVTSLVGSVFYALIAVGVGIISDHFGVPYGIGFGISVCALSLPVYIKLYRHYLITN